MSPPQKLLDVVLAEFQKTLRATYDYEWNAKHGQPPSRCYVEHVKCGRDWRDKGAPISAWMVSLDSVEPTSVQTTLPPPKTNGMFFDLCRAFFSFTPDSKTAFISWQTGPRFGRGFRHAISEDTTGSFLLGKGECLWMS